jgi:tetratricopeptide (TPR) repeat protein
LWRDSNDSAEKVLQILDTAAPTPVFPYGLFRAHAFHRLGRLEESAHFMTQAVDANEPDVSGIWSPVSLLSEILDKIELWQQNARDFNEMLQNCARLAQFAYESSNDRQTALILAEFSILQGKRGQPALSEVEGVPFPENDSNWLRPKARLLMAKGDFNQAALLWAKIADLRRNDIPAQNRKSYNWWQAKFYGLDCLAKLPFANRRDIYHTIEVLQNTYPDIPSPWAEKLRLLKGQPQDNY